MSGVASGNRPPRFLQVRHELASGTDAGDSVAGWNTRALNTVVVNDIPGASLSDPQLTLPAGTYDILAFTSGYRTNGAQAGLYATGAGAFAMIGNNAGASKSYNGRPAAVIQGRLEIATTEVFELRFWVNSGIAGNGLGNAVGSGELEIYSQVCAWKIR